MSRPMASRETCWIEQPFFVVNTSVSRERFDRMALSTAARLRSLSRPDASTLSPNVRLAIARRHDRALLLRVLGQRLCATSSAPIRRRDRSPGPAKTCGNRKPRPLTHNAMPGKQMTARDGAPYSRVGTHPPVAAGFPADTALLRALRRNRPHLDVVFKLRK